MEPENKDISKLILLIKEASKTYQKVAVEYADDHLQHFFKDLSEKHEGFIEKAGKNYNITQELPVKNQLKEEPIFNKDSAIDQLVLCKEMEKAILNQAREAVHNNGFNGEQKLLLCKQLTFSENALFKADQMLEIYE
ncbi:MAG: hypothetical protein ACNS60_17180 [Candidatus Cyclobacteriaceae bacterium M2_1C_046]